jgi:hypothetical protein
LSGFCETFRLVLLSRHGGITVLGYISALCLVACAQQEDEEPLDSLTGGSPGLTGGTGGGNTGGAPGTGGDAGSPGSGGTGGSATGGGGGAPSACDFENAGSCYRQETTSLKPWSGALIDCQAWGGSLVAVNSVAENDLLKNKIVDPVNVSHWIGLSDLAAQGTFVWSNGDALTVTTLWEGGTPSNGADEDCVEILFGPGASKKGFWNDTNCVTAKPYFCEKPL